MSSTAIMIGSDAPAVVQAAAAVIASLAGIKARSPLEAKAYDAALAVARCYLVTGFAHVCEKQSGWSEHG